MDAFLVQAKPRKIMNFPRTMLQKATRRFTLTKPKMNIPFVIEHSSQGERTYDIYSRLLKDRIICLHGQVDERSSSAIVAQLLFLESVNPELPIYMYINSPGGVVSDGLAIYDTMQFVQAPVRTVCMGLAASMGSLLLAAGEKGNRYCLPNSKVMIHQPSGGTRGQATDIAIHATEILKLREQLNGIYSRHTGQHIKTIETALDRDKYMTPEEAMEFGLIDQIMAKKPLKTNE